MLPYHIMLPSDIWKELFPGRCNADLKGIIENGVTLQAYNKSEIPQLGTFYSGIYLCPVYSNVHLCVHHCFPCTSMCTIYSHIHTSTCGRGAASNWVPTPFCAAVAAAKHFSPIVAPMLLPHRMNEP